MIHARNGGRLALSGVAVVLLITNIRGQTETSQAVEIVAARYVAQLDQQSFGGFAKFALDARSYVIPWLDPSVKEDSAFSFAPAGHTIAHLNTLVRILGIGGIVTDSVATCAPPGPDPCRVDPYAGLVAFSPVVLSGDTAKVILNRWERVPQVRERKGAIRFQAWHFRFVRTRDGWRLLSVHMSAS